MICQSSLAKARIELQANLYASCLLMPRKLVFAAWDEVFQTVSSGFFSLPNRSTTPSSRSSASTLTFPAPRSSKTTIGLDRALDSFAKSFAEKFLVSPVAMRIRLEKLALLHRTVPLQRLLSDGL